LKIFDFGGLAKRDIGLYFGRSIFEGGENEEGKS